MSLQLYGFLVSQPTRAVAWLLKVKGVDYEFVPTNPHNGDVDDAYLKMNPNGLVPVIKQGSFSLFESNAILTYLSEKHGWVDVYPTNLEQRAKVNQYLHWHHSSVRKGTKQILIPYIHKARGVATAEDLEHIAKKDEIIDKFTAVLEELLVAPFVAETQHATIADYACYCEMDQLEAMGVFDFSKYPKVHAWLARMKQIPFHDEIHQEIYGLLDALKLKPVKE